MREMLIAKSFEPIKESLISLFSCVVHYAIHLHTLYVHPGYDIWWIFYEHFIRLRFFSYFILSIWVVFIYKL